LVVVFRFYYKASIKEDLCTGVRWVHKRMILHN
jgi:hypothetical protein